MYDVDAHVAEVYDQSETYDDDVQLIRRLLSGCCPLRILEPFCGTGRILIPLALDGHNLTGMDLAKGMLARTQSKVGQLPSKAQERIALQECNVLTTPWPQGFDLVVLGGNCFYELATPEEQEYCVASAATSLLPGGHVYIDNNHMEGELEPSWRVPGVKRGFPTGLCRDGVRVESTTETIWFDVPRQLARFRRSTTVISPDGSSLRQEYEQQKHPVSTLEAKTWLEAHCFLIEHVFGDRSGGPYQDSSNRAIFWARKL